MAKGNREIGNTRIAINRLVVEQSRWGEEPLLQWQEKDWQCPGQWRRQSASSRIWAAGIVLNGSDDQYRSKP